MAPPAPAVAAVAMLLGGAGGAVLPAILRRLSPPPGEGSGSGPYAGLASARASRLRLSLASSLACGVVAWRLGWSPALPAWLYLCVAGVLLAFVDWRTGLLPTAIVGPSYAVVAALLLAASAGTGAWDAAGRALLGWLIAGGLFFAMWFIYPAGMGYGDVRLSGLLGLALGWLGWPELGIGIYGGFVLGAVAGGALAVARVVDRRRYPFGPFMLLGALGGVVWGAPLLGWYASS